MPGNSVTVQWGDAASADPGTFSYRFGIFPVGGDNYSYLLAKGSSLFSFDTDLGQWNSSPWTLVISDTVIPGDYEIRFVDDVFNPVGDPSPPFTIGTP
jgi:hypothetical protein